MATESDKVKGFKRINFFKGFLTTEHDWNDAERYHIDKRRLHNRMLHAPGVVFGYGGDLKVVARARDNLSVEVQPGYAIDGDGRDLMLFDAEIKTITLEEYKLPQTIYIVLRYYEQETDFIAYKENAAYKGNRKVLESCKVEISQTQPDIRQEVELCRILLDKNAARVRDAKDPNDPKANELDLRFVPRAGVAGSYLDPVIRIRIAQMLDRSRKTFIQMARDSKVETAHDALAGVVAAQALHAADQLDQRNALEVMAMLAQLQDEVAREVDISHPQLGQKREFQNFKKQLELLKQLLGERRMTGDVLNNLLSLQLRAADEMAPLYGQPVDPGEAPAPSPVPTPGPSPTPGPRPVVGENEIPPDDMERIKGLSELDLPMELEINGEAWLRIDTIKCLDADSEKAHDLNIVDAKDTYRSRQRLKYPNETVIEDTGRAHVGGYVTYKVKGVTPGKRLLVIRRMDYVYGDYSLDFEVDGKAAGTCECPGTDRVHRWRNWPHILPAEFIVRAEPQVKQIAKTAGRDINMFRYWFYQPRK